MARGTETRRVALLAQSKLDEIAAAPTPLPPNSFGVFAGTRITWQIDARDIASGFPGYSAATMQDVSLTLTWGDGGMRRTATFWTRHLGAIRR